MIFEKDGHVLSLKEFESLTGAKWIPNLEFEDKKIFENVTQQGRKLYKKGELTLKQIWLGKYFQKEISSQMEPNVAIRYINTELGWGVFALKDFRKMQFIAEYVGKVRKRQKKKKKNAYCFEYIVAQGVKSSYTINAMEQGTLARYINHSAHPNLEPALVTLDDLSHIIFYTKEPIAKGAQLCYDYGPDYWAKRTAPMVL